METRIDPKRRDYLAAKYVAQPPVAGVDDIVDAIYDAGRLVARSASKGTDNGLLFDPSRSPEMYAVAQRAHRELRIGLADGRIDYVTPSGGRARKIDDSAYFIHFVGDDRAFVCKAQPEVIAAVFHTARFSFDRYEVRCNINIAHDCGGPTTFYPLLIAPFLLLFEACASCQNKAVVMAETGWISSEMEAHAVWAEER